MAGKRRSLKELAEDPRHVPGIFNYCDRWCERCPATSRCLLYATEQAQGSADPACRDIRNQAFWKRLEAVFREAGEMLQDIMHERGIELEPVNPEEIRKWAQRHDDARKHPCALKATEYGHAVTAWLEKATPRLQEHGESLARQLEMELPGVDPEGEARRLKDAIEVIHWYQYQIGVKIVRAVSSAQPGEDEDFPVERSDADGSAKVALIGVDRSLVAWAELLRQLPDEEDALLPLLATLSTLRRDVEAGFPLARTFIRPGFDTGEV
jgi:hypothetical protein